jgi:hypothetical protein
MHKNNKKNKNDGYVGWCELLLRKEPLDVLESLDHLKESDYESVAGALPICEFIGPFSVYETFHEGGCNFRPIREYDVINVIVTVRGVVRHLSLLIIDVMRNSHLFYSRCHTEFHDSLPLGLLGLKKPLDSFENDKS